MNMNQASWAHVRLALQEAVRGWINDPNVLLIDYGWTEKDDVLNTKEFAIRTHVIEKFRGDVALESAIEKGKTRAKIPDTIAGFRVDKPQSGELKLHRGWWASGWRPQRTLRTDPMQGGISLSNLYLYGSGTLGGLVFDRETGDRMILSNWHVLAGDWRVGPGWPICQPGWGDGGSPADTVATFSRHAMASGFDAAVARLLPSSRELVNDQFELKPVRGVGWARPGMEVIKSGRTTGVTYGRVTGVEGTAMMPYGGVNLLIGNVVTIVPRPEMQPVVSAGGDSGSLWLEEETMRAVGLHFAGGDDPEHALAIDMQPVLDALDVELLP